MRRIFRGIKFQGRYSLSGDLCSGDKMSMRRNVRDEMSVRRNVHATKCPCDEMSMRRNVHATKCPCDEMSMRQNVHATKCPFTIHTIKLADRSGSNHVNVA